MTGILDLLNSDIGKTIISGVAGSTGQDTNKTSSVLTMALPVLMKAMQRNAATPQGAESLKNALNKHDGGILDNLGDLFNGGVNSDVLQDGGKILGHVLGNKQQGVEQVIGQKAGMDTGAVADILKTAAPILMGLLGKQSRQENVNNSSDLSGLLGGLLGGNSTQKEQSFLEQILDADGDGSIVDDVAGMILGNAGNNQQKSGGLLGGLLGGVFGKK
ncbi:MULTISPECIES: DUF937 domain-containing protein [Tenacibaculum]|uniref:DUF937 domain-containing protein n=2 Tax=Tenacibaculum TaxID=104267 RepID=A0AAE9SET6_9FLAO|nr:MULTISPECIES: DUF937 domain-containing protein [Tenacibaculum]GFD76725.1 hypothetical protein KUL113_61450 [Tenacibaculum sp. KUL113]GFD82976.1 hypothetical protein KUL118_58380 [Tenacibaculum sp. KUL118]GFD93243.1 hypothetical protein KUL154_19760 [Alteromonas sp. KUL154]AZJ31418.1 DUF937 domain-containing protein [Tenacibaculum mesophilum]MCG7502083.1 DUF937 domain-containing protein [Tenacibaculum sp. Mcav3-52]|eukprot:TRINITY_DN1681_c0_g3_i1.p1 TRINITY_DN1681_c0_g3~~TRINITY_DN1681_c0_g3_i1.p1  ORF type:complete len:217 (+),score=59.83 TRINITY_DN1681_c0_g3_i1:152-802(+)